MQEQLVTIPRTVLEEAGDFQGIKPYEPSYLPIFEPKNFIIMPRDLAEEDPSHKQLIVYFTIRQGCDMLYYWRSPKKGDSRLSRKCSIGFGGHMNDGDYSPLHALGRELTEEMHCFVKSVEFRGFINDDSDPVGKVHLGLYFDVEVESNWKSTGDENIDRLSVAAPGDLRKVYPEMEGWSKLIVDFIEKNRVRFGLAEERTV